MLYIVFSVNALGCEGKERAHVGGLKGIVSTIST